MAFEVPGRPSVVASLPPDLAAHEYRPTLRRLVVDILRRPGAAMRSLADHPDRRWVWPLAALMLATTVAAVTGLPAQQDLARRASMAQIERLSERNPEVFGDRSVEEIAATTSEGPVAALATGSAVVGSLLGPLLGVLVVAAIVHFLGTVIGGQQTFTQALTITSWAHVPLVPRELLRAVEHLTGGFDASPNGLSGLVACNGAVPDCSRSWLEPVLAQIELWNLWYLALLVVGVAAVAHVARRRALVTVAVVVALQIALGLAAVGASRFAAGFAG